MKATASFIHTNRQSTFRHNSVTKHIIIMQLTRCLNINGRYYFDRANIAVPFLFAKFFFKKSQIANHLHFFATKISTTEIH